MTFLMLKNPVPFAGGQGMASIAGHPLTGGPSFSPGASASSGETGGAQMLTGGPEDPEYRKYVEWLCEVD
jgi:hypothetical protein